MPLGNREGPHETSDPRSQETCRARTGVKAPNEIGRTEGVHGHCKIIYPISQRFAARDGRRGLPVCRRFTGVPCGHVAHQRGP